MSYPQPSSNDYTINGYQFFRLNTLLVSPGDVYESMVSGLAIALGPESDIANVNVAYFDDQAPNFMNRTVISPLRSFVGRLDARNDSTYSPAKRPGRILLWSDDLYDPNYTPRSPASFNPVTDAIQFVAPRLDVIQYFNAQPSLVPYRQNKIFDFQNYPAIAGRFYLVVPCYGRKYTYINFTNRDGATPNTVGIVGLNYAITQDDTVNRYHQETVLRAPTAVAAGASFTKIINANVDGMFDSLVFNLTSAGPAPLRIVMSDTPGG